MPPQRRGPPQRVTRHFLDPYSGRTRKRHAGAECKAPFLLADEAEETLVPSVERMWVVVTDRDDDGYTGVVAKVPTSSHAAVRRGSIVRFGTENICDVDSGPPPDELEDLLSL